MKYFETINRLPFLVYVIIFVFGGLDVFADEWVIKNFEAYNDPVDKHQNVDSTLIGPPNIYGRYIDTPEYKGYALPLHMNPWYTYYGWWFPSSECNLSDEDIALAEEILRDKLKEYCIASFSGVPDVLSDMSRFIRQYTAMYVLFGESKGERIVFLNLVNKEVSDDIEKNHPEYFTITPLADYRVHIYEAVIDRVIMDDHYAYDWDEIFTITAIINLDNKCIESIGLKR